MTQLKFKTRQELKEWAEKIIKLIPIVKTVFLSERGYVYISDKNSEIMFVGQVNFSPSTIGDDTLATRPLRLDEKYPQDTLVLVDLYVDCPFNRVWFPRYSAGETNDNGELLVYKDGATYITYTSKETATKVMDYSEKYVYTPVTDVIMEDLK